MRENVIATWVLGEIAPTWNVRNRHSIRINASVERTYQELLHARWSSSPVIRTLLALRSGRWTSQEPSGTLIERMESGGFVLLAHVPNREIVFGLAGQFWKPSGGRVKITAEEFRTFTRDGYAKATMHMALVPLRDETELRAETRVTTYGRTATTCFRAYWTVIEPFSGWIRREMLAIVKREAERAR